MKIFTIFILFIHSISYAENQRISGETLFNTYCSVCHGVSAKGIYPDWKKTLKNGKYPPPPLNGTAHAWHHPPRVLLQVINNGGAQYGGEMPAFKDVLTQQEKLAIIDYFQSLWPNDIKQKYNRRFDTNIVLE